MRLIIVSPRGIICNVETESITLPGSLGSFTILRNHAPIISTLTKGDIVYIKEGKEERVSITSGAVNVAHNNVEVCVE